MPTINDVARLAGVSRATVSRVLMNSDKVRPETAAAVRKAIKQSNYRPSLMARGLVTGRLNLVALLMSETDNPFFLQMVGKLDQGFRRHGHIMSICYLGDTEKDRRENFRNICQYGFAGFLVGDINRKSPFIDTIRDSEQNFVFFNRYTDELPGYDAVLCDNYHGGYMATRHLIDLGHRRVGMLTGPRASSASMDRFEGYRKAMADAGLEIDPELIGEGDLYYDSGYAYAKRILERKRNRCTAVFAGNDPMAIGILNYCREVGVKIPEDMSLVGFDDIKLSQSAFVNLTTVQQPYVEMSSLIVERMMARINKEARSRQVVVLDTRFIERKTTLPPKG